MENNMRKLILPLTLALIAAAPGAAFAASTTAAPAPRPAASSQADQAHTLTLADGKTYQLPANFKDPGLKMGEKITVHWKMDGAKYDATSVTLG
jgi:hypothetical protein